MTQGQRGARAHRIAKRRRLNAKRRKAGALLPTMGGFAPSQVNQRSVLWLVPEREPKK